MEQFARILKMLDSKWLENLQNKKVAVLDLAVLVVILLKHW